LSDSDYLISIGCSYLVEGDIPSDWGDDGPPWSHDMDLFGKELDSYCKKNDVHLFDTFEEAIAWAKKNPGRIVVRFPFETYGDSHRGYISKPNDGSDLSYGLFSNCPYPLFDEPKELLQKKMDQAKATKQRQREIINWLYKTNFVRINEDTKSFTIKRKSLEKNIKLKNGQIVSLYHFLCEEGVIYPSSLSNKVGNYYFNTISGEFHFSKIKSDCSIYGLPRLDESFLKELSKYKNVSEDQNNVILPEDSFLAWKDNDTGLFWDVARVFNPSPTNVVKPIHKTLNELNYAGFNDWRIPSLYELKTLLTKKEDGNWSVKKPLSSALHESLFWASTVGNGYNGPFARHLLDNKIIAVKISDRVDHPTVRASVVCVSGKIKISSDDCVNGVVNWAAKEEIARFPFKESEIVNLKKLDIYSHHYTGLSGFPKELSCLTNLEEFRFTGNNFPEFPESIYQLSNLKILHAPNNKIKKLSNEIKKLKKLKILSLTGNQIKQLPEEVVNLKKIRKLDLSSNPELLLSEPQKKWIKELIDNGADVSDNLYLQSKDFCYKSWVLKVQDKENIWMQKIWDWADENRISEYEIPRDRQLLKQMPKLYLWQSNPRDTKEINLPAEICYLKQLLFIEIYGYRISNLPIEISTLPLLERISLKNNGLNDFPKNICNVTHLCELSLPDNNIKKIPVEISQMKHLRVLNLGANKLNHIPQYITQLESLKHLDLSENKLSEVPKELCKLTCLESINLSKNNISKLPNEIKQMRHLRILD
jgi:Leucine-rich repeat (LRR) protein